MHMQPSLTSLSVIDLQDGMLLLSAEKYLRTMEWILWESWHKAPGTLTPFFRYHTTMLREDFPDPLIHYFWRFMVPSILHRSWKSH